MIMRRNLHIVGTDPGEVFDDLAALREAQNAAKGSRRTKARETFARFPHDRALALYRRIGGAPWAVLVELDRAILRNRGRNPIPLPSRNLRVAGVDSSTKCRALRKLEAAGIIRTHKQGHGRYLLVTHLWYPIQP
jgi:hypothetical protein